MIVRKAANLHLKKPNEAEIRSLYWWKYIEEKQPAKQWNGPYIPEEIIDEKTYFQIWQEEIDVGIPAAASIVINGKAVGYTGAYWVDRNTDWLEAGIVIYDPDYWNGGYGSTAFRLWIDYLFSAVGIHRIGLSTWSGNTRMIRAAEKMGFTEEARIREARLWKNKRYDAIKMGVLRQEWEG
ncbi:GNAT family N-acetyltransferase [Alkalicoccus luteus]|uniref:GNAT family N-acetyltransferase n=1 Tax=Alkalicoccus luteus TaxID=1237094 RepID=A0A969TUW5_9BACI|nr:GNAT family protein [Alkalicoccus luteus]NJP37492.1 GNAT family N-acetyltransferase [Alkalicoccus luteus]